MFDFKTDPEPSIEDLKISELTVAQFRRLMQECFNADRSKESDRELAMLQSLGVKSPSRMFW